MAKKRVAVILGYVGTEYCGSQMNKEGNTIEKAVFEALGKVGGFKESNAKDYAKIGLQRSSRTDKRVHAAMNVISVKVEITPDRSLEDLAADLAASLAPRCIKIHRVVATTKGFDAKKRCEERVYEYFVPQRAYAGNQDAEEEFRRKSAIFSDTLHKLQGSHDFHNFTLLRQDRSTNRYVRSIQVDTVRDETGLWQKVTIYGQSFILHQIRKMIGLAVLAACSLPSPGEPVSLLVADVFGPERRNIPKAPGEFLLLASSKFDAYNEKVRGLHPPITPEGTLDYKESILYPVVCTAENILLFDLWHQGLQAHAEEFEYISKPSALQSGEEQNGQNTAGSSPIPGTQSGQ